MELLDLAAMVGVGFVSSFITTVIGGGGGIVSLPGLMLLGLPAHVAVATLRFSTFGTALSSSYSFHKAGKIAWKYVLPLGLVSLVGAFIGAQILIEIDEGVLTKFIGLMLLILLPFTLMKKNFGLESREPSKLSRILGYVGYFFYAIYDAFFGVVGGIFGVYLLVRAFGLKFINANATEKIVWLVIISVAAVMFAREGLIDYYHGVALMVGMLMGGYAGSQTAIKIGDGAVKIALSIFVLVSALKFLFF